MLLLVVDRLDDPVTPLLSQWTYQVRLTSCSNDRRRSCLLQCRARNASPRSCVADSQACIRNFLGDGARAAGHHEQPRRPAPGWQQDRQGEPGARALRGAGRVLPLPDVQQLRCVHGSAPRSPARRFAQLTRIAHAGDLGVAIKGMVDEFQVASKSNQKISTIADMQRFVENYPEFRAKSGNVSKHVTLMGELSRLIDERHLMQVSQVEQVMLLWLLLGAPSG